MYFIILYSQKLFYAFHVFCYFMNCLTRGGSTPFQFYENMPPIFIFCIQINKTSRTVSVRNILLLLEERQPCFEFANIFCD